jgi:hypothetical protein
LLPKGQFGSPTKGAGFPADLDLPVDPTIFLPTLCVFLFPAFPMLLAGSEIHFFTLVVEVGPVADEAELWDPPAHKAEPLKTSSISRQLFTRGLASSLPLVSSGPKGRLAGAASLSTMAPRASTD